MLDVLCYQLTLRILIQITKRFEDQHLAVSEIGALIDSPNALGFSLVHYFSAVNYHEAIKFIASKGANVNLESKNDRKVCPLMIAVTKNHERSVQALMQCGATIFTY